ncbi:MAG: helix-turn-helix transcriptional regulator [Nitrososphaeraceae archaeon]
MNIKKAIELIEGNNKHHLEDIVLYNEILKKYEELNKTDPPHGLTEQMQQIFLDMVTMIKKSKETQIRFNNGIIMMLTKREDLILPVQDRVNSRRNHVRKLFLEGYSQKEIAQKVETSLSTVEKDLNAIRKRQ